MIYFIEGKITKRIKIGHTDGFIDERMQPMQSSSPDLLMFLGGMSGDRKIEYTLHEKFKEYRSHGEWFNEHRCILDFIKKNCIQNSNCLEIINGEVLEGNLLFEEALRMSEEEIIDIQRERISKVAKKLYRGVKLPDFEE